jgi:tRNA(adenine34) deaminase
MPDDEFSFVPHMRSALGQAHTAAAAGEVPVGAVIVKEGRIIAKGYNRMEQAKDPTAHAEIIAIGSAAWALGDWRLNQCSIYVTLEPCCMCLGAICSARIQQIVYAAADPRRGAVDSLFFAQEITRAYHYFPDVVSGICTQESARLLQDFFTTRARTR